MTRARETAADQARLARRRVPPPPGEIELVDIPIGTPVRYWPGAREGDGRTSRTRTATQMFRDVEPVVCVDGYPGFIALTHVDVISEDEYAASQPAAAPATEPERRPADMCTCGHDRQRHTELNISTGDLGCPVCDDCPAFELSEWLTAAVDATRSGRPLPRPAARAPRGDQRPTTAPDGTQGGQEATGAAEGLSGRRDCLFCAPNHRVLCTIPGWRAILDNYPATPGHALVVPDRHVDSWFDLTPADQRQACQLLDTAKQRLAEQHSPDGWTIGINDGPAAGRTVDHLHIHLIPRYAGDMPDPRGGIRRGCPNGDPTAWTEEGR
jgi:diadenosine tetraphosphate (Ap4A) HIT family hydrolase